MKRYYKVILAVTVGFGLVAAERVAWADGLSVETYMTLSVARLELVKSLMEQEQRSPAPEEIAALWQRYGTSEEEYMSYRSRNSDAVTAYLAQNSALSAHIENLSTQIDALIAQQDGGLEEPNQ